MAIDQVTGLDFDEAPGTMSPEAEAAADQRLFVQFYVHPMLDQTLTEGGVVHKKHAIAKQLAEQGVTLEDWDDPLGHIKHHVEIPPAGRPIYRDTEFVRISAPGNKLAVIEVPVTEDVKKRFAVRYKKWKAGVSEDGVVGTPLRELRFMTPARIEELRFYNIRTVEQLAGVSDDVCSNFMGLLELRKKAQLWLDDQKGLLVEKVVAKDKERDAELAALQNAVRDLQKQLAERDDKKE